MKPETGFVHARTCEHEILHEWSERGGDFFRIGPDSCLSGSMPVATQHMTWMRELARDRATNAQTLGRAMRLTLSRFHFATGRQTEPMSAEWLRQAHGESEETWDRFLKSMRRDGWLTIYARVKTGSGPIGTPMYLLTVPEPAATVLGGVAAAGSLGW